MNFFVVVEGKAEGKVYKRWIPYVNPHVSYAGTSISDLTVNSFAIISGQGFPYYLEAIRNSIEEINEIGNVDKLVVAADSENMMREEKLDELEDYIRSECAQCSIPICIVVQHFCFETCALGNRRLGPRSPRSLELRRYKEFFCVYENDPELLPPFPPKYRTRAQFAKAYLKAMLKDRNAIVSYSSRRPNALYPKSYFDEVKKRFDSTGHIISFDSFLKAFDPKGS